MFRFASGQLVLVALTACVGAQSSGFLKSQVSRKFGGILPGVSVQEQYPDGPEGAANANEDAALQRTWEAMVRRHKMQQMQVKVAMDKYAVRTTEKYACIAVEDRRAMQRNIASHRRTAEHSLLVNQRREKMLFMRRMKCMQQVPGDQSTVTKRLPGSGIRSWRQRVHVRGRKKVSACMRSAAALYKAPVAQYRGVARLTQNDQAALKKFPSVNELTDRFQQMQEHAMNDALESLFNTEQKYEQTQMEDTWEKDDKKEFQHCEQSTDSQKADVDKRTSIIS